MRKFILLFCVGLLLLAACSGDDSEAQQEIKDLKATITVLSAATPAPKVEGETVSVFDQVMARGTLRCGVQGALPGFGFLNEDGTYTGIDTDFCRALAVALFNDVDTVEFVDLATAERFPALAEGRIDVLVRNTTWTYTRDAELGFDFGPVQFYDGQGIMVRSGSGIFDLNDLTDKKVCVQSATTSELNIQDTLNELGVAFELVAIENLAAGIVGLLDETCDAFTGDTTALIATRATSENADDLLLMDAIISQEPLAPVYQDDNSQWGDIIRWTIYGLIHAERLGITSENIDTFLNSNDREAQQLLGKDGDLGAKLGLRNSFIADVIAKIGNYAEIYDRNLGEDTLIDLPRGQNTLWTRGGLIYAPPFR